MGYDTGKSSRRTFHWPSEAEQLVRAQGHQCYSSGRASKREQVISRLIQMSGNPRGACLRFMRRLGLAPQRSYREWTTGEQRHLIELGTRVAKHAVFREANRTRVFDQRVGRHVCVGRYKV